MADPLSIAASVGGLALLARDIVKLIVSVTGTVRGASSELQELRQSVALLCGYLESLSLILDDDDDAPAPMSILACNQTLDKIKRLLEKLGASSAAPASTPSTLPSKHGAWQDVKQKVRWVIDKDEAEKLLADLEKHKSVLSLALSKKSLTSMIEVLKKQDAALQQMEEMRKEQSQMRQQQIRDAERRLSKERREMLSTVSQMRPEGPFKKHLSLHQNGTGVWFLESPEFEKFMSTSNSKLWLYGIPGAGKSVLSATIINHLKTQRTEKIALAYFFCEYFKTATQTCRNIFGSIARQLALQNARALEALEEFFNDQTDLSQLDFTPDDDELLDLIVHMSTNFDNTIIIVDGLDECQENRAAVVGSLAQLSRDGIGSVKTLFTSRKESDIEESLASFDSLSISASKADVRLYVAAQLKVRFRKMCEKDPTLSEHILTVLVDKSEGMFQWVRCQIDCLENLASNKQRRKALEDLPRDLHGTYERILLRAIKSSEHATIEFVERTLRWIALAVKPLSVAEIAHAISVEVEERSFDDSLDMRIILALCSSLVREVNGVLSFSHFSVKEYLMQISPGQGQLARFRIGDSDHSILAQTCLTYILLDDFDKQGSVTSADLRPAGSDLNSYEWWIDPYPRYMFYRYAASSWILHAKASSGDDAVSRLKQALFNPTKTNNFIFWAHFWIMGLRMPSSDTSERMYDITPLHLACIFGFTDLVDMLICNGAKVNAISEVLGSPLRCAIFWPKRSADWAPRNEDRYETVRRLLSEPVSKDQSRYDPLADALDREDLEMASILLEHGFTLTRSAVSKLTSKSAPEFLLRADLKGLDVDVELSLRKNFGDLDVLRSSPSAQDITHRAERLPFHFTMDYMGMVRESCSCGRLEDVKKWVACLEPSLTADRLSDFLSECLVKAAAHGHSDVVQYLVEASADPTFQKHSDGRTALHEASDRCHADVVRKLLEISDDRTAISGTQDNDGLTPWMCAIKADSIEILELFLTCPSMVNLRTTAKNGQTAAHLAVQTCNEQMVFYLKERGIDFTCLDDFGASPIHALLEPLCNRPYIENFDSFRRIFQYLQWSDMLSGQIVQMIAQLDPRKGKLIWQDIRDNPMFDETRGHSLTVTDSQGNTALHLLMRRDESLKYFVIRGSSFYDLVEFIQLLSTDKEGDSKHLYVKNKWGRTPILEFARSIRNLEIPKSMKQDASNHILRTFRALKGDKEGGYLFREADIHNCTMLHYIALCKTDFPFQEITEYILEQKVDGAVRSSRGAYALTFAAYSTHENVDFMRLLIPRMSLYQLEENEPDGYSMLHYICRSKKAGIEDLISDFLLQAIGESEVKDPNGRIPLTYAPAIITDDAIASRLIQYAVTTIDICDNDGKNCMYWSCELGSIAMASALLDAGANIDAPLGLEMSTAWNPPLLIAAISERMDTVKFLLERGADPLVKGRGCCQLHHHAFVLEGCKLLAILEHLPGFDYDAKADLRIPRDTGEEEVFEDAIPLHFAAISGNEQGLRWLLDQDKVNDVNVKTRDGSTPLMLASLNGHYEACKLLIKMGSLISKARYDGRTALHTACQYGRLEVCKLLIAADNHCVFQNYGEHTPLELATKNGYESIVELLLKHKAQVTIGAEINARQVGQHDIAELLRRQLSTGNGTSAEKATMELDAMRLRAAYDASSESTFVEVLQKDINPNIRFPDSLATPLHYACHMGWKEAVELLVEKDANIEALDKEGCSPLIIAVRSRQFRCAEWLCQRGAQTTTRDMFGWTVLHEAADLNDFDSLSYFLKEGMDVNVKTYRGFTPLHFLSDPRCVGLLLEYGADPFNLGPDDETVAWKYSLYEGGAELLRRIFADQPADEVQQNIEIFSCSENSTPLYRAAFLGNYDVVSTLIEYGANTNGDCGPLGAPFHAALSQGHVGIATTLLENGSRPYRIVRDGEEQAIWYWEYGYEFCLQDRSGVWMSGPL